MIVSRGIARGGEPWGGGAPVHGGSIGWSPGRL